VALRNRVFQMVTGSELDVTAEDMLLHFSGADATAPSPEGSN